MKKSKYYPIRISVASPVAIMDSNGMCIGHAYLRDYGQSNRKFIDVMSGDLDVIEKKSHNLVSEGPDVIQVVAQNIQ